MKKTFSQVLFYLLLAAVFFTAVLISQLFLRGFSLDLTDDKIYSLSPGSVSIVEDIEEPINLYFFFSDTNSKGLTAIRDYANRVETILRKYQALSNGKINLEVIDPVPFSEAEDRAASFGLTAAGGAGGANDAVYFGLAGTNSLDDGMIIGFFDPQKESFLEYDISKLIYQLSEPEPIHLALVTDLPVAGGPNPMTMQNSPPTVMYQQMEQFFDVSLLSGSNEELPSDTELLVILHPQNISPSLINSIDQFMMKGGKAIVFVDPHYESELMAQRGAVGANSSSLDLLEHYGVAVNTNEVVLDSMAGLEVRGAQGNVIRHLGFLGLGRENINQSDITTADLDSINGASFGSIKVVPGSPIRFNPLLQSTKNTSLMKASAYANINNPEELGVAFKNAQTQHTLAARITGRAQSIISQEQAALMPDFTEQTSKLNLVVVADADITADRFWVQQSSFFGQAMFSPFANNGDLVINVLENLGGSEGLIGVRSRGTFLRPFTRVEAIRSVAEDKFRTQEQRLQSELEQTEQQLIELQSQSNGINLSPEQKQAIDAFTEQKITIRKALRNVQFQLDKDINALGNTLKIVNIVVAPFVLVFILFLISRAFRKTAKS